MKYIKGEDVNENIKMFRFYPEKEKFFFCSTVGPGGKER